MRARGFSLVELSIVVLVIGIVLTMGIGAWTANLENQAHAATAQRQAAINDALSGYFRRNKRLPCPDTDLTPFTPPDGQENRTGTSPFPCVAGFGVLPYVTLGLARDVARDGWGNLFSYHVSNTFNAPPGVNYDWTVTQNFNVGNAGGLTVKDRNPTELTVGSNVVAVVVSHGRNGFGAYTVGGTRNTPPPIGSDEGANTNGSNTYYRREPTTNDAATGGPFDDQVMFITAANLLDPLFRDGTLKETKVMLQELLDKQKKLLIGYAIGYTSSYGGAGCNSVGSYPRCRVILAADTSDGYVDAGNSNANGLVPYLDLGLTLADAVDPWGQRLRYTLNNTTVISTGPGGGLSGSSPSGNFVVMTLMSRGPDLIEGTADDISVPVTAAEIRSFMIGLLPP
jgi:prepilin-type N-terminal cleavage/methylation domain-containing protein